MCIVAGQSTSGPRAALRPRLGARAASVQRDSTSARCSDSAAAPGHLQGRRTAHAAAGERGAAPATPRSGAPRARRPPVAHSPVLAAPPPPLGGSLPCHAQHAAGLAPRVGRPQRGLLSAAPTTWAVAHQIGHHQARAAPDPPEQQMGTSPDAGGTGPARPSHPPSVWEILHAAAIDPPPHRARHQLPPEVQERPASTQNPTSRHVLRARVLTGLLNEYRYAARPAATTIRAPHARERQGQAEEAAREITAPVIGGAPVVGCGAPCSPYDDSRRRGLGDQDNVYGFHSVNRPTRGTPPATQGGSARCHEP